MDSCCHRHRQAVAGLGSMIGDSDDSDDGLAVIHCPGRARARLAYKSTASRA